MRLDNALTALSSRRINLSDALSAFEEKAASGRALNDALFSMNRRDRRGLDHMLRMAAAAPPANSPAQNAQAAAQANAAARAAILGLSQNMFQQIYTANIAAPGNANNVINIQPRNVGLIKGFLVKITATVVNSDAAVAATLTPWGISNLLSQVVYNDLNNNTRIQTAGWHLFAIDSAKRRRVFGSAVTTDTPMGFNAKNGVIKAASNLPLNSNTPVTMYYWVPLAYADNDLRGAVYANVINATQQLQLTLNPNPGATSAQDPTTAIYQFAAASTGAITLTNVNVTVYQRYLDQLPQGQNGVILPYGDLSYAYELKNTALSGLTANQDFPLAYSNFRQFLSTLVIFDNVTAGAYPTYGSDVNYWGLQTANFTNIWKLDPTTLSLLARASVWDDFPVGTYFFDSRDQPINTIQYGNMQLVLNASTVNAGASCLIGYEDFALLNTVTGAGSLA